MGQTRKIIFLQESHQLDEFLVEMKELSQRSPTPLFSQPPGPPKSWLFHQLVCLGQRWIFSTFGNFSHLLSGFLSASGEACHEYSLPPIISLEVSKTSQHLGRCQTVGSGAQACSQVLLAAADGSPSVQLWGECDHSWGPN